MLTHTTRASRLFRLLAFALAAFLVVQGLGDVTAEAAGKRRVTVSRHVSSSTALTGDAIAVAGRVSAGAAGTVVALQRYHRGKWSSLRSTRLTSSRTYRMTFTGTVASSLRYRVVSRATSRYATGVSKTFVLRYLACTRMKAPSGGRAAWFTRPGVRGTQQMTSGLAKLFCSAARGATVNVSMYFIRASSSQTEVNKILQSLERVSRYRGVKVRIMLEGRLYRTGTSLRPSVTTIKRYATVLQCQLGCRNERYGSEAKGAIMHHKLISISNTTWRSGTDQAVVMASANWSQTQLTRMWQSAVLVHRDAALYREADTERRVLDACAGQGGCSSWNRTLTRLSLPPQRYALTSRDRLWHEAEETERTGNPGSGLGMFFFPWAGADPVAEALRGYTCTPEHRTIRVAHMFMTSARMGVVRALSELREQGCDVSVVIAPRGETKLASAAVLRDHGIPTACTAHLHDKAVIVNAVRRADGLPDKTVLMGSHSLSGTALRSNDEGLMRISTYGASGSAAAANAAVWSAYMKQWSAIRGAARSCA